MSTGRMWGRLVWAAMLAMVPSVIFAAPQVSEIVERANKVAFYQGNDGKAAVKMEITDSQGRVRNRSFIVLRRNVGDAGEQKYYVYFKEPADVRDMVYMVWKHLDRDDDRWMYLPALDLVRRIAASDKRSSFVGSNFVYEDISGRSLDLDRHELIETTGDIYKVRNTPKDGGEVEFSYYDVSIKKENFMPIKAEYYDKQGKRYRTIEALEMKDIQGYPTVTRSKASDLEAGSSTTMDFSDVTYDIGLEESIFSERYLRRPPLQWVE
jgi:hypothetical protein